MPPRAKILTQWSPFVAAMVQRGIDDGDVIDSTDPDALSRRLISIYMGLRQIGDLDEPLRFFADLEHAWNVMLPGIANSDRLSYFIQFVGRCTVVAQRNV